jgi:hypothetical protein
MPVMIVCQQQCLRKMRGGVLRSECGGHSEALNKERRKEHDRENEGGLLQKAG